MSVLIQMVSLRRVQLRFAVAVCLVLFSVLGVTPTANAQAESASSVCGCDGWMCPLCQQEECDTPIEFAPTPWNSDTQPPIQYQQPVVPQPDPFVDDEAEGMPELPAVTPNPDPNSSGVISDPSLGAMDTSPLAEAPQLAFSEQSAAFGGRRLSVPDMIGPFFGPTGGQSVLIERSAFSVVARGFTTTGSTFDVNSSLVFETSSSTVANDFTSIGVGRIEAGDILFDVSEPVPPNDAPTSPSSYHTYDGGTARLVNGGVAFMDGDLWQIDYGFSRQVLVEVPISTSTVVGQMRIAENTNPRPRDRIFMNYSLFDGVRLLPGGVTVNRFSPGFEKTYWQGNASFEMRFPFATTLDSEIVLDAPNLGELEFGDIYMVGKFLLLDTGPFAFSAGMAMTIPTADDTRVFVNGVDGMVELARVNNEAVHLVPFIGCVRERGRWFSIGFAQLDFDVTGNEVAINSTGRGLDKAGTIREQTYMEFNWSTGYWLMDRGRRASGITKFAAMGELHYRRSLEESEYIQRGSVMVGSPLETVDYLGGVAGAVFQFGENSRLTVGYTTLIGNDSDQQFDGELRAFWNQYF